MTQSAPTLTFDRNETKYLVDRTRAASLALALSRSIAPFEHVGKTKALPSAHHFTTTIYLDTPSRTLYRAAIANPRDNVKLRAREYYDLHPSLAELATNPADVVRYEPTLWFELKRREDTRTTKHRFCLRKVDVPAFFAEGAPTLAAANPSNDESAHVADFWRRVGEPLSASSIVSYRRLSFQDPAGRLRVTLDVDLAYFEPPPDLWSSPRPLVRSRLGTPRGRDARALVEVKLQGIGEPEWIARVLADCGARAVPFSKFEEAEGAVRGRA
jgi:hypothetical protein